MPKKKPKTQGTNKLKNIKVDGKPQASSNTSRSRPKTTNTAPTQRIGGSGPSVRNAGPAINITQEERATKLAADAPRNLSSSGRNITNTAPTQQIGGQVQNAGPATNVAPEGPPVFNVGLNQQPAQQLGGFEQQSIEEPVDNQGGVIGPFSTTLGDPLGINQASRLLTNPLKEIKRILFGTTAGAAVGVLGTAALTTLIGKAGSSAVNQASTIGKSATGAISKVPTSSINVATRFASNTKTNTITKRWLIGLGAGTAIASQITDIIGTYPFAGFIKEEALQTVGFGIKAALDADNLELAQQAIDFEEEVLDVTLWEKIIGAIPYANVQQQNKEFYKAARIKLDVDKSNLEKKQRIQSGEIESDFARERRESDEASRERELAAQAEDDARFAKITATREAEAATKAEESRADSAYFELIKKEKAGEEISEELLKLAKTSNLYTRDI